MNKYFCFVFDYLFIVLILIFFKNNANFKLYQNIKYFILLKKFIKMDNNLNFQ